MVTIPTFQTTITEGPLADDKAVMLVARATDGWHHHVIVRPNWRKRLSVGHKMFAIGVASAIVLNILEVAKEEEGVSLKMIELSILHTETPGCRGLIPKYFLRATVSQKLFELVSICVCAEFTKQQALCS